MWPWGHVAVGYLLFTAYRRYRDERPPTGPAALAVLVGTQFPDLVDKPLAWTFGVLESGRSLGHSWLVAAVVLAVLWWTLDDDHGPLLGAFAVGWLSHGIGDAFYSVVTWELAYTGFLLWPVTDTPPSDTEQSFIAHLVAFELEPMVAFQTALFAIAVVVWYRDGRPGLDTVRTAVSSVRTRALPEW